MGQKGQKGKYSERCLTNTNFFCWGESVQSPPFGPAELVNNGDFEFPETRKMGHLQWFFLRQTLVFFVGVLATLDVWRWYPSKAFLFWPTPYFWS